MSCKELCRMVTIIYIEASFNGFSFGMKDRLRNLWILLFGVSECFQIQWNNDSRQASPGMSLILVNLRDKEFGFEIHIFSVPQRMY